MKMEEIYKEIMENLRLELYELFDDWDENGNRITVLNNGSNVVMSIAHFCEEDVYVGQVVNNKQFEILTYDDFVKQINEMYFYLSF